MLSPSQNEQDSSKNLVCRISGTDALCDGGWRTELDTAQHAELHEAPIDDMFAALTTWCEDKICGGEKLYSPLDGERDYLLYLSAPPGSQELSDTLPPVEDLKSDLITALYVHELDVSADWLAALCDVMPSLKTLATKEGRLPESPFLDAGHAEVFKKITFYHTCEWYQLLNTQAYRLAQAEQAGTGPDAKDGTAS
ncbi:hypothetical protein [Candidatus Hepatobacter penaei]|uniref:hypothetical protein n=1 Tax=Candidatus Hepatobacter penaei TaxID=1274402 RepID=UPI0012E0563F|nr:hypothetical protein [Candidatus Hepatobacter penaei]